MKKLLALLFALFILFSFTKVLAAQGVDCQNIKFPNLSALGFELKNEQNIIIIDPLLPLITLNNYNISSK